MYICIIFHVCDEKERSVDHCSFDCCVLLSGEAHLFSLELSYDLYLRDMCRAGGEAGDPRRLRHTFKASLQVDSHETIFFFFSS